MCWTCRDRLVSGRHLSFSPYKGTYLVPGAHFGRKLSISGETGWPGEFASEFLVGVLVSAGCCWLVEASRCGEYQIRKAKEKDQAGAPSYIATLTLAVCFDKQTSTKPRNGETLRICSMTHCKKSRNPSVSPHDLGPCLVNSSKGGMEEGAGNLSTCPIAIFEGPLSLQSQSIRRAVSLKSARPS